MLECARVNANVTLPNFKTFVRLFWPELNLIVVGIVCFTKPNPTKKSPKNWLMN